MSQPNRRSFVTSTVAGTAAVTAASLTPRPVRAARSKVVLGLIGCGGRGTYLAQTFLANPDVEIAYVCDPDQGRLAAGVKTVGNAVPQAVSDLRRVLDDKRVDAVIVATPDHWHAPAAILACKAGKHVYVEKPCSHTIREGRLLVEAARKNNCVVQHGTQVRSTTMMIEAVQALREGIIGDVLVAKAWNIQKRRSIGKGRTTDPPAGLDYETWVGPAPMIPYQANRVHGGWHWWYHFGTGDMGNDGVHDIDYCRWGLGVDVHPSKVVALGGKFFFDDDQQFPDTQQVTFEYPAQKPTETSRLLVYEQRLWSTNYPHNVDSGVEFYGTAGQMFLSRRGKLEVHGPRHKRIDVPIEREAQNAEKHVANFLASVRAGTRPNGDIELGHLTTTLCHLGNHATRLGTSLQFDPQKEEIVGDEEVRQLVTRDYRDHWGRPS